MEWQPIETAPRGEFLVFDGESIYLVYTYRGEFYPLFTADLRVRPTHWMPLPAKPK